jgi:hypothetical protein
MTKLVNTIPLLPLLLGLLIGASLGAALGYFGQCTSGTCPLTSTWWRGALYGAFLGLLFAWSFGGDPRLDNRNDAPNGSGFRSSTTRSSPPA